MSVRTYNLFKIPFLNITRNIRRTALTCGGIAFGITALVLFEGYFNYMIHGLRETMIRTGIGHVQIYKKGFETHNAIEPEKYLLTDDEIERVTDLIESENLLLMSKQTEISGLISNGKNSFPAIVIGAEAENINVINSSIQVIEGEFFDADEIDSINIGQGLAKNLNAGVGDVMTLLASTTEGYVNAVDVSIAGIIETGIKEIDERIVYANLEHINRLYDTEKYSKLILLLDETKSVPTFVQHLKRQITAHDLPIEYKDWRELAQFYHQVKNFLASIFSVLQIIIISIVIFFISNTMIMNVMERIPEIGTIRAIGETKMGVLGLFMVESFYFGLIGGILGIAIGYGLAETLNGLSLQMPPPPTMSRKIPLFFILDRDNLLTSLAFCSISAVFSGFYPAWKAANMKVTDALRYV